MKVTLEFDLMEAYEKEKFQEALEARDYHSVLWHLDQHLRGELKYKEHSEEVTKALQAVRDKLHNMIEEFSLKSWEM